MGEFMAGEQIGQRLRMARQERDLSQLELANLIQRRQATVSDWEQGHTTPTIQDLYEVARVLDRDIHYFLPKTLDPPPRAITRAIDEQLPLGARFQGSLDLFLRVAAISPVPQMELDASGDDPIKLAENLVRAAQVRTPPLDVFSIAARCGVRVIGWEAMDAALSGLLVELDDGPLIAFNSSHPIERARFTVAHELGHQLLGHITTFHVDLSTQEAGDSRPGYNRNHEKAANSFAANLLMPEAWIRALDDPIDVDAEAKRLEVSELAFGYRLMALGLR